MIDMVDLIWNHGRPNMEPRRRAGLPNFLKLFNIFKPRYLFYTVHDQLFFVQIPLPIVSHHVLMEPSV